jgi:hypothetical protein
MPKGYTLLKMRFRDLTRLAGAALVAIGLAGCAAAVKSSGKLLTGDERFAVLRRAQVWKQTDVATMNITRGPDGGYAPEADVECDYSPDTKYGGHSPKFGCAVTEKDIVKVRYGADNGEVYAGVAATRLLWALGYGADSLYPVHVICRHCPETLGGVDLKDGRVRIDIAAIERPFAGHKIETEAEDGWPWSELDLVQPAVGGAPRAQRDALKLLAVMLQHSDSKADQQRLICQAKGHSRDELINCPDPFMLIHDVGLTFGHANWANHNGVASTNFPLWSTAPVWKDRAHCVGNLSSSISGTLKNPAISEEGRAFLAGLLAQLTDAQVHDLFAVARFDKKPHGGAPIDAWVAAFKQKVAEIQGVTCPS